MLRRAARAANPSVRAGVPELVGLCCVAAFGYSLYQARHTRIGFDVPIGGYLTKIGVAWYLSLGVMIVAIAFYAWRRVAGGVLFAGLQLVSAVFAVPILVYSVPRSPAAQKHMDIVSFIIAHGKVDGIAGIYADWNGFFSGVAAALDGVGDSSDRIRLETYWPLLMALTTFAVVVALCRIVGYDRLTGYLVGTVACLANVLQQDYFSPQSMGYILALCLFAVCLANPRPAETADDAILPSRRHPGFRLAWWQLWYALDHRHHDRVEPSVHPVRGRRRDRRAGAVGRARPFRRGVILGAAVTVPVVLWALIHFDIISDFLSPDQLGNASNFTTPQTLSAPGVSRLPIVAQSSIALLLTLLLIGLIAVIGGDPADPQPDDAGPRLGGVLRVLADPHHAVRQRGDLPRVAVRRALADHARPAGRIAGWRTAAGSPACCSPASSWRSPAATWSRAPGSMRPTSPAPPTRRCTST